MQIGSEDYPLDLKDYLQGLYEIAAGIDEQVDPKVAMHLLKRAVEIELMGDTPDAKQEDKSENPKPIQVAGNSTSSIQIVQESETYVSRLRI